jgi:hypothetical protein
MPGDRSGVAARARPRGGSRLAGGGDLDVAAEADDAAETEFGRNASGFGAAKPRSGRIVTPPYPFSMRSLRCEAAWAQAIRVWLSCRLRLMAWMAGPPASPPGIDRRLEPRRASRHRRHRTAAQFRVLAMSGLRQSRPLVHSRTRGGHA